MYSRCIIAQAEIIYGEKNDSLVNDDDQSSKSSQTHEKETPLSSDDSSNMLYVDETCDQPSCQNEHDAEPGHTQSTITKYVSRWDKSKWTSSPITSSSPDEEFHMDVIIFGRALYLIIFKVLWLVDEGIKVEFHADGSAPEYFRDMTVNLDCVSPIATKTTKEQHKRKIKAEKFRKEFDLTKTEVKQFKKHNSVTKTSRALAKHLYLNADIRSQTTVLRMPDREKNAIINFAKILHPSQCSVSEDVLRNAIGNVFSVEKQHFFQGIVCS
ncbi:unnamed protein product [Adineta ricciae]|uniref:BEN domain-containing protein n=1 Tax=Adineta ricciae TaxID=249248 RepID=A0A815BML6_ADIRI|nr:unnamed protein product [Adineta ricciae]CAF1271770.1 unnamed protein product [Adineta ricciae]